MLTDGRTLRDEDGAVDKTGRAPSEAKRAFSQRRADGYRGREAWVVQTLPS